MEWDRHECVLANKWGLGFLSVNQDGGADPFWWGCSAGAIVVRWDGKMRNIGNQAHKDMFKLINISKLVKLGYFVQTQTKYVLVRQVIHSAYCASARQLKIC